MANLAPFRHRRYISLETYRRNGAAVRTPIWFAEEDGRFFCYSMAEAGKVKRIRNNPRVAVAPSDARGNVQGEWMQGTARLLTPAEAEHAHAVLRKKYGWQRRLLDWFWVLGGRKPRAAIEIAFPAE